MLCRQSVSMEKAQRAELLRQRFQAKAGKWQYVSTGRTRPDAETPKPSRLDSSFGFALSHRWGRTEWLETPDAKTKRAVGTRNRKGIPALTVIAAKAPKKLTRRRATAEGLLSERKPQSQP